MVDSSGSRQPLVEVRNLSHAFKLVEAVPDRERVWDSPIVIIIRHLLQFS